MVFTYTTCDRDELLPKGWRRTRLKDICSINSKLLSNKTPKNEVIDYIDISSITFPGEITETQRLLFSEAPSRARRVLKKGNVLVGTVRPNHRATFYTSEDFGHCIASTGFSVLEADESLSPFIYFFTLSKQFCHSLTNLAVGTSFPAITDGDILSQKIALPPEERLSEICSVLENSERLLKETRRKLTELESLKKTYLNNLMKV